MKRAARPHVATKDRPVAPRDRLRDALTTCEPQVRARLQEAFRGLRSELTPLFRSYDIRPDEAEKLLEEVALRILPLLKSGAVHSPEGLIFTLTEHRCRTRRPLSGRPPERRLR